MIKIDVPDMNDSVSRVTLAEKEYMIRFTWNHTGAFWSFGLYDMDDTPILHGTKIVPFSPLTASYTSTSFPDGLFGCYTAKEKIGRMDFVDGVAEFVFIPNSELAGWKPEDAYE